MFQIADQGDGWLGNESPIRARALQSINPGGKWAHIRRWLVQLETPMRDPATQRETHRVAITTDADEDLTDLDEDLWSVPVVLVDPDTTDVRDVKEGMGWTSIKARILPDHEGR